MEYMARRYISRFIVRYGKEIEVKQCRICHEWKRISSHRSYCSKCKTKLPTVSIAFGKLLNGEEQIID